MKCSVLDLVVLSVLWNQNCISAGLPGTRSYSLQTCTTLFFFNERLYSSLNERLMYVYIRDLQMPMRTALGMNTQRQCRTLHWNEPGSYF